MRKIAGLVSLFLSLTLLAGCSQNENSSSTNNSTESSKLESLVQPTPTCSAREFSEAKRWITGQLNAFSESKPDKAYSYASESFRMRTSLEEFSAIILAQYTMLLNLKEFTIIACEKNGELFFFNVNLIDNENIKYRMEYILSLQNQKWGVDAAAVYESVN